MRSIVKGKWLVLILWIAVVAGLVLGAPDMKQLVHDKGQITVPDGYPSMEASALLGEMNGSGGAGSDDERSQSTVLVFHDGQGLSDSDKAEAKRGIEELRSRSAELGIVSLIDPFTAPEVAKQAVSADGKTLLVLAGVDLKGRTPAEARDALGDALKDVKVEHYYTGNWLIQADVEQSSQDGLKKTEGITVVFILAILFVVFRSAVAPFVPLLTIGISYVASQAIVAYLVKYVDFPLSNFTQIFLVAIMFGIGTDYCILLISRFKEELAHGRNRLDAILTTYRTAGKTVLFSGLAVFVGFATIGFSTFGLFRSAVAVAVGVAVLMLALFTLVPFFLAALGPAIFWPAKGSLEHKPNRPWAAAGRFSFRRPLLALLILAAVIVPFLSVYKGTLSFNSLDEIGDKYDSVKAFNTISASFGPGESLPSTVVIKADKPLGTMEGLAALERVSAAIAQVDGVKTVRSATRPTGEALPIFQQGGQAAAAGDQQAGGVTPEQMLQSDAFQAALNAYLSQDGEIAKLDVIFSGNPYDVETLKKTDALTAAAKTALAGTGFEKAEVAVGGVTSVNHDLRQISSDDYTQTVLLMIVGIGIILIILFRSIVIPVYIIVSLLGTYYTSMAVTELIFVHMLGYSGTSWVIPFFGFVMLMALGVDYSIFLMDRFKEYRHLSPKDAILKAMSSMGTVILSAAVILGGTFAAMIPSGVLSLMQIAAIVLCGLFLYAVIVLPLFVPVMVRLFGKANWWPFMGERRREAPAVEERSGAAATQAKDGI